MEKIIPISGLEADEIIEINKRLIKYDGHDRVVSSDEIRKDFKSKPQIKSFPTGIDRLDKSIGNIEAGELIAIGGATKNGKTLLAQTITANMARNGISVLWFTFEVPAVQFLSQMPDNFSFFMPRELKQASLVWLRDRIIESKLKNDTRIVFVDNLHHLVDFASVRNVSLDLGIVIRTLKRMAIDLNVAIVILCHSKKQEVNSNGERKEPTEWDLRDSSFIPQECDSTIMIQRCKLENSPMFGLKALIKVCLHRRTGAMGDVIHLIKTGSFFEEDVKHYSEMPNGD